MTDLTPVASLDPVVQLETNTLALGGTGNPMNQQAQALLNRDAFRANEIAAAVAATNSLDEDIANSADPLKGAGQVGYRGRSAHDRLDDQVFVTDYGAVGDGVADDTAAILSARTAAIAAGKALVFPGGTYAYTDLGQFAASQLVVVAEGKVTLKHTGAGVALKLDAGAVSGHHWGFRMLGNFFVQGNALTTTGVFARAQQHAELDIRVLDVPGTAFVVNFAVLSRFRFTCTINEQAMAITPAIGVELAIRGAGETITACDIDLIIEGVTGDGVVCTGAVANTFKGTSEGNGGKSLTLNAASGRNHFEEFFAELNSGGTGIEVNSGGNTFLNCTDSTGINIIAGKGNVIRGGRYLNITVGASAERTVLEDIRYDNLLTDAGINTLRRNVLINGISYENDVALTLGFSAPTLAGAWTNYGSGDTNAGHSIDASKVVRLRGSVNAGAGTIFTLPAGRRPPSIQTFAVANSTGVSVVSVDSAGVVALVTGSSTRLSLNTISFVATN